MAVFTSAHLGKWESLYKNLIKGEQFPLTEQSTWIMADKPGLIALFDEMEVVYIGSTEKIGRTLRTFINGGVDNDLRAYVAETEFNIPPKHSTKRSRNGLIAKKINRRLRKMTFRVTPAPKIHLKLLSEAFSVVSDAKYNGPSAKSNRAIDSLPQ